MNLEVKNNRTSKLILQYAVPSIIAMVLTSMINIVDGYFVGNYIDTEGLAAINLGLPIVYFYLAVGLMIAVGGIAIAGRLLGAGEIPKANQVFRQTIVVCTVVTIIISIVVWIGLDSIVGMFRADGMTQEYFCTYYGVLLLELPLMVVNSAFGMFIRGEGNPMFVMVSNIVMVLLNIVLDFLFVGPFGWGIAGIAWASFIAALIVTIMYCSYFMHQSKVFRFGTFKMDTAVLKETILNGSSEFIGELSMCISMSAYNYEVLKHAGVDGVAAFTIIGYISYVFSMIIIGFGQGSVPLISYSFGAKEYGQTKKIRNKTVGMVVGTAIIIFIVMSIGSRWYCGLFSERSSVIDMVDLGLKLQMSSFVFAGINTIASFYFTSIGKAKESAVISTMRGLVVLLIAIYVLPAFFGITGVWVVSLVTETITFIVSALYMKKNDRVLV